MEQEQTTQHKQQPISKKLLQIKAKILKSMKEPKGDYVRDEYNQINNLDGYPTDSSQLRDVDTTRKAQIMRVHLSESFPNNTWSVRTKYYSGNSSITAYWKGDGLYPYGATAIGSLYSDAGATDTQSDYFDIDNYVHVYDGRNDSNRNDPQTIAKNRADRLCLWISNELVNVDYTQRHNWASSTSADFVKDGKFTPFTDMTESHKQQINKICVEFAEQENREGVN